MKIYTIEKGYIYAGGMTIFVTTKLSSALKKAYFLRKEEIVHHLENRDKSPISWRDCLEYVEFLQYGKWYWRNQYEYIQIKEWEDQEC